MLEFGRALRAPGSYVLRSWLMLHLIRQYRAWEKGILPGREVRGYGAMNPRLLRAFDCLSGADAKYQQEEYDVLRNQPQ